MEHDPSFIPAATVDDIDLSGISPSSATEIQRLGKLMDRGDETPEQFAQLVRLLHNEGFRAKAEFLLRRNMITVADGAALYRELYGTEKPDEFAAAIEAFAEQFSLELELVKERDFRARLYHTTPHSIRFDDLRLLSEPCEVRFDYANENAVEADVSSLTDEQYIILRWINGVWEPSEE